MFDKLKQLKQLKDMQNALGKEKLDVEKDGVKVTINGKMEIESISLNGELETGRQEKLVKDCLNDAMHKMQMRVAQKMAGMPALKSLGF